ncbi:MAG TPA: TRAP transporter fused permease subunit [Burkholderiales bacterium]|jgi:TRAP transporter 4TM/12TM fusion protein|nr:TRAP transporter fused permease subunit [Burkholderiales bacterium]
MAEESIEAPRQGPRRYARTIFVLQALLTATVVGWVLDLHRAAGLELYTEQFLVTVLGFAVALCFLMTRKHRWDAAAAVVGLAICLYVGWRYPTLVNELTERPLDGILMAAALCVLVLEGTRRLAGFSLVGFTLAGVLYALWGHFLPGVFQARPVEFTRLLVYLGLDTNALLGTSLQIGIIVVVPFILMGQVLSRCGGAEFFTDLAMAWMGRYRGGTAKIAVVGSAFFGMISGSAVANVSAVGVVTIPLMKRAGFPPQIAAAIEAVGSTGGQLMPPVMGAAAFLMAEILQVPYREVMIAAILPALLYYLALFFQVDLEAAKRGIRGMPAERLPQTLAVLKAGWYFPIPFVVLVVALLEWNLQAEYAALLATAVLIGCTLAFGYKGKRVPIKDLLVAIVSTGGAVVDLVLICAVAGLFIGILNISGLAFGLTLQLLAITGESLPMMLLLTALMAVLLGLGLPTVGVYVIMATLIAPALVKVGIAPMAAHMFLLYFGIMSMVTPPVALAAFAAANIAGADVDATGWTATRIGWAAYLVPFLFVLSPPLLMQGGFFQIAGATLLAALGIWLGTVGVVGYFNAPVAPATRVLLMGAGTAAMACATLL